MMVSFDLQGGSFLLAARGITVAALLYLLGALLFRVTILPTEAADGIRRRLRGPEIGAAALGIFALLTWLALQSAAMADANTFADMLAALPEVATHTVFGHLMCLQLGVLLATHVAGAQRPRAGLALAGAGVLLQAGHSHAFAMDGGPGLLLLADGVHLLAAGAWLGGLVPLLIVVRHAPPRTAALACRRFSPMGKWCVGAMAATAAYQGWVLVASVPGLVGTAYGWMVGVKLALFAILVGFACANRYRFAPALRGPAPEPARAVLVRSIMLQSGVALAVIAAASSLSQLPPAMHTQPWWPFRWQFSASAVREDADIRREVVAAALVAGGGAALLAIAFFARRRRVLAAGALAGAVAAFGVAMPHFSVLLVDATPTSFYRSPTGFAAATITQGRDIFAAHCVGCHGADGAGDGKLAKTLAIPPADLTALHLWAHADGQLFWWLTHGIDNPAGGLAMPGFGATLDADQRWAVIDYIRAHNAGTAAHGRNTWPRAVQAPGFTARCDGRETTLPGLRGNFVRLLIGPAPAQAPLGAAEVIACFTTDATVAAAYEIVSGVDAASIGGTEFLIDAQGWLRAMQRHGATGGWDDATTLAATIADLRATPVQPPAVAMDTSMPGMKM
jgi:putative copper export protein/mono/diheme cytochrome c family protein